MENKKLKIAFLNIYQKSVLRGSERVINDLSFRMKQKGHTVEVLSQNDTKVLPRWPILWRLYLDPNSISIAIFTLKKLTKLWTSKYDVIIPSNGGWQPVIVRIFTWIRGGKMIIIGHSGIGWDDRNNLWSFPDYFVAISKKAESWAKRVNPFVRIKYIPNGVDTTKFSPTGKKLKIDLPKPIILCVAALEKNKRVDLVIKAVSKTNVSLLVVGDGPGRDEIKKTGGQLLGKRFKLKKYPFEKMPAVYRSADLFTLASKPQYSFEVVILEAMASGLGVVVNRDPIRADIVGEAGFMVKPTDSEKYGRSLERALKQDWKFVPVKQAKKYDWENISEQYEKLFLEIS